MLCSSALIAHFEREVEKMALSQILIKPENEFS